MIRQKLSADSARRQARLVRQAALACATGLALALAFPAPHAQRQTLLRIGATDALAASQDMRRPGQAAEEASRRALPEQHGAGLGRVGSGCQEQGRHVEPCLDLHVGAGGNKRLQRSRRCAARLDAEPCRRLADALGSCATRGMPGGLFGKLRQAPMFL